MGHQIICDVPKGVRKLSEARFRSIAELLVDEGQAPGWFEIIEYVRWTGATKDLARIRGATAQQCLSMTSRDMSIPDSMLSG